VAKLGLSRASTSPLEGAYVLALRACNDRGRVLRKKNIIMKRQSRHAKPIGRDDNAELKDAHSDLGG
jgi:hypothetical protein